jgi:hypothetical protein
VSVPRPKVELSVEDRAKVRQARERAESARTAYKATLKRMVQRYPQASVARALGITPQALTDLLRTKHR